MTDHNVILTAIHTFLEQGERRIKYATRFVLGMMCVTQREPTHVDIEAHYQPIGSQPCAFARWEPTEASALEVYAAHPDEDRDVPRIMTEWQSYYRSMGLAGTGLLTLEIPTNEPVRRLFADESPYIQHQTGIRELDEEITEYRASQNRRVKFAHAFASRCPTFLPMPETFEIRPASRPSSARDGCVVAGWKLAHGKQLWVTAEYDNNEDDQLRAAWCIVAEHGLVWAGDFDITLSAVETQNDWERFVATVKRECFGEAGNE